MARLPSGLLLIGMKSRASSGTVNGPAGAGHFSRVVGWSIDAAPAALVTNAPGMAVQTRTPPAGASSTLTRRCCSLLGVIQRAKDSALVPSMGGVAECYDNAMIEAFGRGAGRIVGPAALARPCRAGNAIFEYLEVWS